ncbi:uncharacterized protein [Amphiura filiformis]|uniref:uncharacterized protein n=1 Tax=Amphiura filiformis TaxID=82378 RepID=UPI003B21891E
MTVRGVRVDFQNLNVTIDETTILKDVSGYALPGQLLAIMGPSGSGKTTLLNVLAGRYVGTRTGDILMNKSPLNKKLKRKIAFVLQQDILFENLTLRETLMYTARLKLPGELPYADKVQKVEDIVDTLDIRKCLDTKIGNSMDKGLSGGEKKRANIGSELLNDPAILLLDEPTSGLDSTTACSLVGVLKKYASHSKKTVVTSIHQPSSQIFYQFDRLILLSEGEMVYFGSAHGVMGYFSSINLRCYIPHYNAADFILDKVKGSKEELAIINDAANKRAWESYRPRAVLSRRASQQLEEIIHHTASHYTEGKEPVISEREGEDTESIELDMVDGGVVTELPDINNGPDIVLNVQEPVTISSTDKTKRTCNHGKNIDANGELPWCEVCVANASPSRNRAETKLQDMDLDKRWPTTWLDQYKVLTIRAFKQSRSLFLTKIDFIRHGFLAVIIGILYFQLAFSEERIHDIRGLLFMGSFPGERTVIDKERSAGTYHLSAYYMAKMTSELPLLLVFPTLHFTVWYWMAGLNPFVGAFFAQWLILMANALVGQSVGLAISAFSSDFRIAMFLLDVYALLALMLGGFFIETIPFWLEWLQYISHFLYIFNLHLRVEFNMQRGQLRCLEENSIYDECFLGNATSVDGSEALDHLGVLDVPVWGSIVALVSFIAFFRLLAYFILKYKYKPK